MARVPGRKVYVDWAKLDLMCAAQCTLEEMAANLDCSDSSIELAINKEKNTGFREYFDRKRKIGLTSLRAKMFNEAMNGNTAVMIFLAKNWLGMRDRTEVTGAVDVTFTVAQVRAAFLELEKQDEVAS